MLDTIPEIAPVTAPVTAPAARPAPKLRVTASFTMKRETKGAVVFEEIAPLLGHRKVRTLYLRKEAFEEIGSPARIGVTIIATD